MSSSSFPFIQAGWLTGRALGTRLAAVMKLVQEKQWMKLGGHEIRQNHSVIVITDCAAAEAAHNSDQPQPGQVSTHLVLRVMWVLEGQKPLRSGTEIVEWFGFEGTLRMILFHLLPWAGTAFTSPACSKPCPTLNTYRDGAAADLKAWHI